MKRRLALAVAIASALWIGQIAVAFAMVPVHSTTTQALPRDQCSFLLAVAAQDPNLSANQKANFATVSDTQCTVKITTGLHPVDSMSADAFGPSCQGYWHSMTLYGRWWSMGTVHANVGLCYDGSTVWRNWGVDCPSEPTFGYWINTSWCGTFYDNPYWGNGRQTIQAGQNFSYGACITWNGNWGCYRWNGYMRYQVNDYGSDTGVWGAW
ncbi:MAG TPA: hypothetical protein VN895_02920 [Candidatus Acidoferrum sp.]|nr:hypothetical protein [Candidatus Acidoferrum sp.]